MVFVYQVEVDKQTLLESCTCVQPTWPTAARGHDRAAVSFKGRVGVWDTFVQN